MKANILLVVLFAVFMIACGESTDGVKKVIITEATTLSDETRQRAADIGRIPTSIEVNFLSGYWHIASGFNVDTLGDFRPYDGTWLGFRKNNEFYWGVAGDDKGVGAWGWDEEKQYIYFFSDSSEQFFIGEWEAKNNGDVVICIGSTPNNPRSTQFKIARRHSKIVSE